MLHSPTLPEFDALRIQRLFRPHVIERVVFFIKLLCIGLGLLSLGITVRELLNNHLEGRTVSLKLENEVRALLAGTVNQPVTARESNPDDTQIIKKNIFGEFSARETPKPAQGAPKSDVKLALIGVFINGSKSAYAIVENEKKKLQDMVELGANNDILEGGILKGIYPDRIEITRDEQLEVLRLDDFSEAAPEFSGGIANIGDNQFLVEEAELDKALENIPLLLTQARAVPQFEDGKSVGLRIFAIRSGSLFEKIGLKSGDVLKSINGNSLADPTQAMSLLSRLKEERTLSVMLERDRTPKEFHYQIK